MALSFQDNAGCLDIWRQITSIQSRAAQWFRKNESSVTDMAHAVAAAHHASLQRQQEHAMWANVASEAAQHHLEHRMNNAVQQEEKEESAEAVAVSMAAAAAAAYGNDAATQPSLPNPPTLQNLEEIADIIAAAQVWHFSDVLYTIVDVVKSIVIRMYAHKTPRHSHSNCNRENRWLFTCREMIVPISKHYCLCFHRRKLVEIMVHWLRWLLVSRRFYS